MAKDPRTAKRPPIEATMTLWPKRHILVIIVINFTNLLQTQIKVLLAKTYLHREIRATALTNLTAESISWRGNLPRCRSGGAYSTTTRRTKRRLPPERGRDIQEWYSFPFGLVQFRTNLFYTMILLRHVYCCIIVYNIIESAFHTYGVNDAAARVVQKAPVNLKW